MVNKLSQTIIDFNKLDKKNIKTIKIGDEIIGPDENGQVILNGTSGGSTGGNTGGTAGGNTGGGTTGGGVPQLPSTVNLFSGSAVGNILLSGPTPDYSNIQDGLLITLSDVTLPDPNNTYDNLSVRVDLSSIGLKTIKIPKEKLIINSSFDISDQLSQYVGKTIKGQYHEDNTGWVKYDQFDEFGVLSFEGTTINVLPNTTLSMNLIATVQLKSTTIKDVAKGSFQIPVIQVNTYKN